MGLFDTVKLKANALAADAERAGKVTAAQARTVVLQNDIRKAERELGHSAFSLIESGEIAHPDLEAATARLRDARQALSRQGRRRSRRCAATSPETADSAAPAPADQAAVAAPEPTAEAAPEPTAAAPVAEAPPAPETPAPVEAAAGAAKKPAAKQPAPPPEEAGAPRSPPSRSPPLRRSRRREEAGADQGRDARAGDELIAERPRMHARSRLTGDGNVTTPLPRRPSGPSGSLGGTKEST